MALEFLHYSACKKTVTALNSPTTLIAHYYTHYLIVLLNIYAIFAIGISAIDLAAS